MREIKFRIWHKNNMDYNDCFIRASGNPVIYEGEELKDDEFTLMQYTGLKDRNSTEIYEGDIINRLEDFNYVVVYVAPEFMLEQKGQLFSIVHSDYQVIGNIYENPELLTPSNGVK